MRFKGLRVSTALSTVLLLAGCGGGGGAADTGVTVVAAPVAAASPTPAATPTPDPTPAPTATTADADADAEAMAKRVSTTKLPKLDLSDMRLWNWGGKWHASEWGNWDPLPWRFDHVAQVANGDTYFRLDATGMPQLQGMDGAPRFNNGLWEADITLPKLRDGLVVAPLWLYDPASKDEIDFEYAGRNGLDLTLHAQVDGQMRKSSVRLYAGRDMSGERHRFAIRVDQTAGVIDMYIDGKRVHRFNRKDGLFVSGPLRPFIEMWAANPERSDYVGWVGRWNGLAQGETLTMTAHGYVYSAGL